VQRELRSSSTPFSHSTARQLLLLMTKRVEI
jgi:hypothetical protein